MAIPLWRYAAHTDSNNSQHLAFWDGLEKKLTPEQKALYGEGGELRETWVRESELRPADQVKSEARSWSTKVKALKLSQPNASTCQAACIAMATGDPDILDIRRRLVQVGTAGDPAVMSKVIKEYDNVGYSYTANASLDEVYTWLKEGELLITHGWFTNSGHVIILDGLFWDAKSGKYWVNVADPWSEFAAAAWKYPSPNVKFYDGYYSEGCIYAACVAGQSASDAKRVYQGGRVDRSARGMWVHRITTRG